MSWADLDNLGRAPTDEERKAAEKEHTDIVNAFVSVFSKPEGKRVFEFLYKRTIKRPTFVQPAAGSDGLAMQKLQDMREGENNLVRLVESMCKQGGLEL
jgi:hypothetical protein